jgi:hypothetical protein
MLFQHAFAQSVGVTDLPRDARLRGNGRIMRKILI